MFLLSTSLPVADPSVIIDDGISFPTYPEPSTFPVIDGSESFITVFHFLINAFRSILNFFDSIFIYTNTSLLEFFLALSVFAILFSALIVSVRSSIGSSLVLGDRSKRSNSSKRSKSDRGGH